MVRPTERPRPNRTNRPTGPTGPTGPTRPPRPGPQAPPEPALQQRGWAALVLGALSLIGLSLAGGQRRAVYVIIVTLLIGAVAVWLGGSAISRAKRGGTARPRGAIGGTVLGGLGLAFSAIMLIVFAVFWNELTTYSDCLNGATTVTAQQACQQQFSHSITDQIKSLEGAG
jgi:hypothetical protein